MYECILILVRPEISGSNNTQFRFFLCRDTFLVFTSSFMHEHKSTNFTEILEFSNKNLLKIFTVHKTNIVIPSIILRF